MEGGEIRRKVEPTIQDLMDRLDKLEAQTRMGTSKVKSYTREKPLMSLGMALLGGLIMGLIIGSSGSKDGCY